MQQKFYNWTVSEEKRQIPSMFPVSKTMAPTTVNLSREGRSRRYLTEKEIERLMDCARKHGRYGHRDATMILVAYRHGLRAICDLTRSSFPRGACMSIASRTARQACIRSVATKCEPYAS
jgi:integrase